MPEWVVQVGGYVVAAAGVYAGIRADLARIHERLDGVRESAKAAHSRIDSILGSKGHVG